MILLLLAVIYGFSMHSSQVFPHWPRSQYLRLTASLGTTKICTGVSQKVNFDYQETQTKVLQQLSEDCVKGNHSLARFGPSCEYLCHCGTNQCDRVIGACPNNGECGGGWMGSGCQYVNIAYNTTVSSNHLSNTATIVDGRRDSCPYVTQPIINPAYIMVSFRQEVKITEVNIVVSNSVDVPQPFAISVSDGNQAVLCGSVDSTNGQKEYVIKCNSTLYGKYLNITYQWSAGFKVCEILVPAGRNLAYGKPAIESSPFEDYYASNAVDGLTYHDSTWLTCTHTMDSTNPWWLLDLQASVMIQWFKIFNRPDSVGDSSLNERLRNFRILVSQDNVTFSLSYQDQNNGTNEPPLVIEPGLKPDVLARFVKIDLQGINRVLSLCEVQVFGDCVNGYYGGNCAKSCINCTNLDCDQITGRCRSCVAGKLGDQCQIDCADGFYGDNCSHECGRCLDRDSCDKVYGHCPKGCQNGWMGANCLQECDLYFYGNCSTPCGHCAIRESCNKVNGSCDLGGCASGWQSENCNIPCDDNYYGNCSTPCGHCKDSSVCNKVNGSCAYDLCSEGWKGDQCNIECNSTYYGENCAHPCGHCFNKTCDRFTGSCSKNGCEPGWLGSRCDIILIANNFQQQTVTDTNVVVIGASVGAAVAIATIIITVVICLTVKRRRKRDTMERNATTMGMSPNSSILAGINADRPIQNFYNTTIENPRAYYNIEELNLYQSGSTNITSINATVEFDVNLCSHYEKLKHHTGAAESAYSAIDHSQSGRYKELLYGANLDDSSAYYNIVQSTTGEDKDSH